jgi:DNA-binding beta-propeller fold protein YncE
MTVRRHISRILTIAVSVVVLGAVLPSAATVAQEESLRNWPPPPQKAKISLLRIVKHPKDFWGGAGALSRIVGRVVGMPSGHDLWQPYGVCVGASGQVVVTDGGNGKIFLIDQEKKKSKEIVSAGETKLGEPVAVAIGAEGDFYVADSALGLLLHFDSRGGFKSAIGPDQLTRPTGLALDLERGRLIVTDTYSHMLWILDLDGKVLLSIGGRGSGDGQFNYPTHVSVSSSGDIFVSDALNHRIQVFTPEGEMKTAFGEPGDGLGAFNRPKGVAIDSKGHIYVVDALMSAVQVFDGSGRLLLVMGEPGDGDGQFSLPSGIFIDERDTIYVADTHNGRLQIFQFVGEEG